MQPSRNQRKSKAHRGDAEEIKRKPRANRERHEGNTKEISAVRDGRKSPQHEKNFMDRNTEATELHGGEFESPENLLQHERL
jgi:hypothetical protein